MEHTPLEPADKIYDIATTLEGHATTFESLASQPLATIPSPTLARFAKDFQKLSDSLKKIAGELKSTENGEM